MSLADTTEKTVYVVVKQVDQGQIALVASSRQKATQYIADNPYSNFMLVERTVDKPEA